MATMKEALNQAFSEDVPDWLDLVCLGCGQESRTLIDGLCVTGCYEKMQDMASILREKGDI